jgi:hypothetical protein
MRIPVFFGSLVFALALAGCCSPPGNMPGGGRPSGEAGRDRPRSVSANGVGSPVMDTLQQQLSEVATALNLTPRQQVLWDDYQAKVGALMADQMRVNLNTPTPRGTMPQIDAKVDTVRNRLAAMEEIAEAARRLYQSLDETQRGVADQRLAATLPALYSGLAVGGDMAGPPDMSHRGGPPSGGMGGGPGGGKRGMPGW